MKQEQEFQQSLKPKAMLKCIFPVPLYVAKRDLIVEEEKEEKEINDIIEEENSKTAQNLQSQSVNSHIFDTKLHNLKEFCEQHIKMYVKEIINPKEELDFYITQSWLNVTKPGESHQQHSHANSIISGSFYIETDVGQTISCYDPNQRVKQHIAIYPQEIINPQEITNFWSADTCSYIVGKNTLLLFPSWLVHGVIPNEQQTKDVISLSFNTFAKGSLGNEKNRSELILQ